MTADVQAQRWLERELLTLNPDDVEDFVDTLGGDERRWMLGPLFDWENTWARPEQKEPLGDWRVWLALAGRGWGKTRTGAEWIRKKVEQGTARRIALVARTAPDARDVMIEGESGILAVSHPDFRPRYEPSKRRVTWYNENGTVRTVATCFSAVEPALLRGPQHDAAWCDELAAWPTKEAWDNLMLGLRMGVRPRCVVTTTPKPTILLRDLLKRKSTVTTGGSTFENLANLAPGFIEDILDRYEGTHLGRQELYAELLDEAEGALWKRAWIESGRWATDEQGEPLAHPDLDQLVVAVDPAGSHKPTSSETGIVVVGRAQVTEKDGRIRPHCFVLEDCSGRYTPDGWARLATGAYYDYDGDCVIGEQNNGGELVESTVVHVDDTVPYDAVWASRGKAPRAVPVAALYQQGRVHHVGLFRDLEDQLCQWEPGVARAGSPDRLDALVWGISYIMPTSSEPRLTTDVDLSGGGLARPSPWREE